MSSLASRALRPPQYRTSFVGRRSELAALQGALSPGAMISLVGPGGVGKTRLASEAVSGLRACFLDLTQARAPSDAAQVVLQALGSRERLPPEQDTIAHAAALLAEVPADVVVLDNLEQLEEAAAFVHKLRTGDLQRSWLLTSRMPIGAGETQIPVSPFAKDGAVDLFLRVLPASAPSALHAQRDRLARLAGALDGLPLALELAAARAAVLSLDELEQRLRDPLRLLVDPARPEDKGSALWRSVSWSVELLPAEVRRVLARCSVFAGWFDARGAAVVAGEAVEDSLQRLVRLHLLREDDGRYRPYEVVSHFAERLLVQLGQREEAARAHARWCWTQSEPLQTTEAKWQAYETLGAEIDLAQRRAEQSRDEPELVEIGRKLLLCWAPVHEVRMPRLEHAAQIERLVPALDSELAGQLFVHRAKALGERLQAPAGVVLVEQVADFARQRTLPALLVTALIELVDLKTQLHAHDEVLAHLAEALQVARSAGLWTLELRLLMGPANLSLLSHGRYPEVLENLQRARALQIDDLGVRMTLDIREAALSLETGALDRCEQLLEGLSGSPRLTPRQRMDHRNVHAKLLLLRHPHPSQALASWREDRSMALHQNALDSLDFLARVLDGHVDLAQVDDLVEAYVARGMRGSILAQVAVEAAATRTGRVPGEIRDRRDPVVAACADGLAVLRQHMSGALSAAEALSRLDEVHPYSWELNFVRRVLSDLAQKQRELEVGPSGAWFAQAGTRTEVPPGLLRRLLVALAADTGTGLDVDALLAAGWPGETVEEKAGANRVRVALTKLRQLGLAVRFERGRGWSLDAPAVRYGSTSTATDRAPSR